jgi:UDP-N-acetyl-D-mannosaminuronic acid dehydrogenase
MVKKICVVGLGYVGTGVAAAFALAGFKVIGIDNQRWKVRLINSGRSPIESCTGLKNAIAKCVRAKRLCATTSFSECKEADVIVICVNVPISKNTKKPVFKSLKKVLNQTGMFLKKGCLVVVETTLPPKSMQSVVKPVLEAKSNLSAGVDFYLAYCPERITPTKILHNIRHCNRVIGVFDRKSGIVAKSIYKKIVRAQILITDCLTAEIVKTAENAYRDVQIAFANELALICEEMGRNAYEVRELINKCPFRDVHLPGAGVGGACIPKDSWLLVDAFSNKNCLKIITGAREINDFMPSHFVELVKSGFKDAHKSLRNSKVTILGLAYLADSDDPRNSPALTVLNILKKSGTKIVVHDPYVLDFYIKHYGIVQKNIEFTRDLNYALENTDCIVITTAHSMYRKLKLSYLKDVVRTHIIIDGRNLYSKKECIENGFVYKCVGK